MNTFELYLMMEFQIDDRKMMADASVPSGINKQLNHGPLVNTYPTNKAIKTFTS